MTQYIKNDNFYIKLNQHAFELRKILDSFFASDEEIQLYMSKFRLIDSVYERYYEKPIILKNGVSLNEEVNYILGHANGVLSGYSIQFTHDFNRFSRVCRARASSEALNDIEKKTYLTMAKEIEFAVRHIPNTGFDKKNMCAIYKDVLINDFKLLLKRLESEGFFDEYKKITGFDLNDFNALKFFELKDYIMNLEKSIDFERMAEELKAKTIMKEAFENSEYSDLLTKVADVLGAQVKFKLSNNEGNDES